MQRRIFKSRDQLPCKVARWGGEDNQFIELNLNDVCRSRYLAANREEEKLPRGRRVKVHSPPLSLAVFLLSLPLSLSLEERAQMRIEFARVDERTARRGT